MNERRTNYREVYLWVTVAGTGGLEHKTLAVCLPREVVIRLMRAMLVCPDLCDKDLLSVAGLTSDVLQAVQKASP